MARTTSAMPACSICAHRRECYHPRGHCVGQRLDVVRYHALCFSEIRRGCPYSRQHHKRARNTFERRRYGFRIVPVSLYQLHALVCPPRRFCTIAHKCSYRFSLLQQMTRGGAAHFPVMPMTKYMIIFSLFVVEAIWKLLCSQLFCRGAPLRFKRELKRSPVLRAVGDKKCLVLFHRDGQHLKVGPGELSRQEVCPAIRMHCILHHSLVVICRDTQHATRPFALIEE